MLYFSSRLNTNPTYKPAANRLIAALDLLNIKYKLISNCKDIWLRDFMPIKTKSGKYVSFRYEPSYLEKDSKLRTDFWEEIAPSLSLENIVYSDINLDGGNVVFSPSREKAAISDRIFMENWEYSSAELVQKLEQLLEARVVIIPSLRSDMTGHADGMVRFVDENTVVGNRTGYRYGLEMQIKLTLRNHGIQVCDFPYYESKGDSAIGCYLNFLETEQHLFLPVFGVDMDSEAVETAKNIFNKTIIPVNINEIAKDGGVLNCISWEN
ncbi:MAG: agmatine deiminase family protein [Oscillospiraceae bacterium]|nr:agmatine deiminase family protein [Oscillospiraceae bacterium]